FLSFSNILHFIRYIKIIMNFNIITTTFSSFMNIWWLINGFKIMSEVLCSKGEYSILISIFRRFNCYLCWLFSLFFINRYLFFYLFTFYLFVFLSLFFIHLAYSFQ